jgi:hypothetical protein
MTRFDLTNRRPSLAAPVRAGLAVSFLPRGEMGLGLGWWSVQRSFVERGPASAQGYGSARAGLQSRPAEKEER